MGDRLGVRGRLLMAFFGISAFAVLAAAAAMHSFLEVGKALDKITQQRVPSALSSLEISRQAERIVAVAPALLTVNTPSQREQLAIRITAEIEQLDRLLSGLQGSSSDAAVLELIERDVAQLETNLDALDALVAGRFEAGEHKNVLLGRLLNTHNAAQRLITPGLMVVEGDLSQLRRILDDPDLSAEARVSALSGLIDSIAALPPLQRAQIETLSINDTLLRIASAPRPAEVEILAFPVRRALGVLEDLAAGISPMLSARLLARLKEYRDLVDGPDSILQARKHELAILADSERLLGENAALSGELTETVSLLVAGAKTDIRDANLDALSVQRLSTGVLVAVVALSLVSSILIVWLYVGRNLIARLTALSGSMLAIARGELEARIPTAGRDEIGDMAQALAVFRDTAIEVRDTNLREIREARQRLTDAIESISEGFSLFDSEDRLVVSNSRYRKLLYPDAEDPINEGTSFETIIRRAAEKGYIEDAKGRIDEWLSGRLAQHRDPGRPQLQHRSDGRWIQVSERKTEDGSTVAVYTDITRLKRAEQTSRDSEQFLISVLDNLPASVALRDRDRRFIRVNREYEKLFGVTDDAARGKTVHELYAKDKADKFYALEHEAIERRQTVTDELTIEQADGDRVVFTNYFPVLDASGEVIASGVVDLDITERKRAEEELRESQQLLETILDHMPTAVYLRDLDGRYLLINRGYEKLHQVTKDGVNGKTLDEVFPKDVAEDYRTLEPEVIKERRVLEREETHHRPDGDHFMQVLKYPVFDLTGKVTAVGGVIVDITDRKRAEEALARKEAQLRVALDNMPGGMLMFDKDKRVIVLNDQYIQLFDFPEDLMVEGGSAERAIRFQAERGDFGAGDVDDLVDESMVILSSREPDRYERKLSTGRVLDISLAPTPDGGTVAVYTDITERKKAEEELAEKEAQLRVALDHMPGGMTVEDRDRNYVLFNSQYSELHDYPEGFLKVGMSAREEVRFQAERGDFGPGNKDELVEQVLNLDQGGKTTSWERTFPNGRTLRFNTAPTPEGGNAQIVTDITERKRAEAELQAAYAIIKVQKERMESELNVGHEIQMSMIPLKFPPFPDHDEFSIYAALEPAREVGGDFYDYYFLDEGRLCFCVGDVSGKGVPAALFMAVTKTLIKSRAIDDFSTASILTHVNAELSADITSSMFVTIFLGILNIRTGEIVYTNAGHNPPFLRRKGGSLQRLDVRHGPVIGAVPGMVYREDTDTMTPGDMLFMYTDGVTEQRNADRELFSEKRLVSLLASPSVDSAENAVRDTVAAVKDFQGDGNQEDDVTLLAVQFQRHSVHDTTAVFHIMARNDLREIAKVNREFQKFAEEHGIPVEVGRRISILFDDLLSNVISYAFPDDEAHEIEIRTELASNRLTVTISDDGIPFNPLGAGTPDTRLPLDKRAVGGLGIHLVRNLVDDVSYQRQIDRNVLTLVKHIE